MSHIKLKYWNKCSNFVKIIIFKWNLIFYIQDTPYLWLWNHVHVCVYAVLTGVIFLEFIRYFLKWFIGKIFFCFRICIQSRTYSRTCIWIDFSFLLTECIFCKYIWFDRVTICFWRIHLETLFGIFLNYMYL